MCVSILRKSEKYYYENLSAKNKTDNKKFWGTVKPLFSNNVVSDTSITLNEEEKLIKNEYEIANIFNTFFIETVPNLGTKVDEGYLCNASNISDPIEKAIQKYKNHRSMSTIKIMVSSVHDEGYLCNASNISDPIEKAIQKYKNHRSMSTIKIMVSSVHENFLSIKSFLQENFDNFL